MKKTLSCLISTAVCAVTATAAMFSVSAETYTPEPGYDINGNKCGEAVITSRIDRDVFITIEQQTQDGIYRFYDTFIPADTEKAGNDSYVFTLEGNDSATYEITFAVPKYQTPDNFQYIKQTFSVKDTDFITDDEISGFSYIFNVSRDDSIAEPVIAAESQDVKNDKNEVVTTYNLSFPAVDVTVGDVSGDNKIDMNDLIMIAKYVMDNNFLKDSQLIAADYNQDGKINMVDAIALAQYIMQKK